MAFNTEDETFKSMVEGTLSTSYNALRSAGFIDESSMVVNLEALEQTIQTGNAAHVCTQCHKFVPIHRGFESPDKTMWFCSEACRRDYNASALDAKTRNNPLLALIESQASEMDMQFGPKPRTTKGRSKKSPDDTAKRKPKRKRRGADEDDDEEESTRDQSRSVRRRGSGVSADDLMTTDDEDESMTTGAQIQALTNIGTTAIHAGHSIGTALNEAQITCETAVAVMTSLSPEDAEFVTGTHKEGAVAGLEQLEKDVEAMSNDLDEGKEVNPDRGSGVFGRTADLIERVLRRISSGPVVTALGSAVGWLKDTMLSVAKTLHGWVRPVFHLLASSASAFARLIVKSIKIAIVPLRYIIRGALVIVRKLWYIFELFCKSVGKMLYRIAAVPVAKYKDAQLTGLSAETKSTICSIVSTAAKVVMYPLLLTTHGPNLFGSVIGSLSDGGPDDKDDGGTKLVTWKSIVGPVVDGLYKLMELVRTGADVLYVKFVLANPKLDKLLRDLGVVASGVGWVMDKLKIIVGHVKHFLHAMATHAVAFVRIVFSYAQKLLDIKRVIASRVRYPHNVQNLMLNIGRNIASGKFGSGIPIARIPRADKEAYVQRARQIMEKIDAQIATEAEARKAYKPTISRAAKALRENANALGMGIATIILPTEMVDKTYERSIVRSYAEYCRNSKGASLMQEEGVDAEVTTIALCECSEEFDELVDMVQKLVSLKKPTSSDQPFVAMGVKSQSEELQAESSTESPTRKLKSKRKASSRGKPKGKSKAPPPPTRKSEPKSKPSSPSPEMSDDGGSDKEGESPMDITDDTTETLGEPDADAATDAVVDALYQQIGDIFDDSRESIGDKALSQEEAARLAGSKKSVDRAETEQLEIAILELQKKKDESRRETRDVEMPDVCSQQQQQQQQHPSPNSVGKGFADYRSRAKNMFLCHILIDVIVSLAWGVISLAIHMGTHGRAKPLPKATPEDFKKMVPETFVPDLLDIDANATPAVADDARKRNMAFVWIDRIALKYNSDGTKDAKAPKFTASTDPMTLLTVHGREERLYTSYPGLATKSMPHANGLVRRTLGSISRWFGKQPQIAHRYYNIERESDSIEYFNGRYKDLVGTYYAGGEKRSVKKTMSLGNILTGNSAIGNEVKRGKLNADNVIQFVSSIPFDMLPGVIRDFSHPLEATKDNAYGFRIKDKYTIAAVVRKTLENAIEGIKTAYESEEKKLADAAISATEAASTALQNKTGDVMLTLAASVFNTPRKWVSDGMNNIVDALKAAYSHTIGAIPTGVRLLFGKLYVAYKLARTVMLVISVLITIINNVNDLRKAYKKGYVALASLILKITITTPAIYMFLFQYGAKKILPGENAATHQVLNIIMMSALILLKLSLAGYAIYKIQEISNVFIDESKTALDISLFLPRFGLNLLSTAISYSMRAIEYAANYGDNIPDPASTSAQAPAPAQNPAPASTTSTTSVPTPAKPQSKASVPAPAPAPVPTKLPSKTPVAKPKAKPKAKTLIPEVIVEAPIDTGSDEKDDTPTPSRSVDDLLSGF